MPVTHVAPASHLVVQSPQWSGSDFLLTHAPSAPVPQMSGTSVVQAHMPILQTKPVPMQSGVLVQAMPEPPPVVVPAAEPPVAVPAVGAEPPAALPPAEVPAL